jgi:hypothetical protein
LISYLKKLISYKVISVLKAYYGISEINFDGETETPLVDLATTP